MDEEERIKLYNTKAWKVVRQLVLERDAYECQHCKRDGAMTIREHKPDKQKVLDVHHIKSLETHSHLAFDMDNLLTLCIRCHNKEEGRFQPFERKKPKWDDERW